MGLKITEYADRLLEDLDDLDWPESLKRYAKKLIGRSEGASINFDVENSNAQIEVFTTRPDTTYGTTFLVLSPEHKLVDEITTDDKKEAIKQYQEEAAKNLI